MQQGSQTAFYTLQEVTLEEEIVRTSAACRPCAGHAQGDSTERMLRRWFSFVDIHW
jgi:hypothetical protein